MRVAMLGQYPLDEHRIVGGIEAVLVPLLRALSRFNDLELYIVTCQPGVKDSLSVTPAGWPLHVLERKRFGRLMFHIREVSAIQRALQYISPDIVHAHGLGIYAVAAARSPYAHVVTVHGIISREAIFVQGVAARLRAFLDSVYARYCLTQVKNFISINPYVEQELAHLGNFRGAVYRIANPVHDVFFTVKGNGEEATILYAGRVIPRKNLLDLLQALILVRKEVAQAQLRVAGEAESDPTYVGLCRRFLVQHDLDNAVTFLGSLSTQQMAQEYERCAVLALPSKQETAPVAVAEAMAAGRPVVATRVCGMPYMVEDGVSGLLVNEGDIYGLAEALIRLLSNPILRRQMGRRGRELAWSLFRSDLVAQQTYQLYVQLVNSG
ncbi:MAG: glycosyltransferase family 4 protein [Anaerolineae bacterium]